ncbi:50S ribosomal protein L23 [Patescibacteria group bacterium]|nr:50S ribosomal protein L23 [Patescibacteria group bacterium]
MALRDFFKKKKLEEKKVKPREKPIEKIPTPKPKSEKRTPKRSEAYRILKTPHITEKATDLARKNQYVFRIWERANKVEVKKAIEDLYKVEVIDVKIIKVPAKRRRFGRISGWKKGYKKAIVKIKEDQKIELFPK